MGEHDAELILIAGVLLSAGIVGALLADRIRVPGLLLFLVLGMVAGSEGIGGIEFDDAELARTLGTIALVLILFEGGLTAGILCALLYLVYRRPHERAEDVPTPGSAEEIEARIASIDESV